MTGKAVVIFFCVFALVIGTFGSFFLMSAVVTFTMTGLATTEVQRALAFIAISLPIMVGFTLLLCKTKIVGVRGRLAIVVVVLLLGFVASRSITVSAHAHQVVHDTFAPLLQKQYTVRDTAMSAEPCFVLYDLDAKEFDFASSRLSTYYSTDVDKINAIVFYSKTRRSVGDWVTATGNTTVANAVSELMKVTVVHVKTWSVIASETFEGVGTVHKEKESWIRTIAITDSRIQGYLNNLFSETDG